MLIPFGTDRPLRRPTTATYLLIGVNIAVFIAGSVMERTNPEGFREVFERLWLDPSNFRFAGLFSYQFLHAGFMHLAGNMVFLYVFGPNVEDKLTRAGFFAFYLVGGAIAGAAHVLLEGPAFEADGVRHFAPVVGASGAIAAVTGAYMVLFPKTLVKVLCLIIVVGTFEIPAWWLILGAIVKDLFFRGLGAGNGVALTAHLGGYTFGIGVALVLLWSKLLPREPYDLFSIGRQAHRRRTFRELTRAGSSPWRADAASAARARARNSAAEEKERVVQEHRAEISRLLNAGQADGAAEKYAQLLERDGEHVMNRDAQMDLANHFAASGQHHAAAVSYRLFLKRYHTDRDVPRVKLLLAVINARYLNDPVHAKQLLSELRDAGVSGELRDMADALRKELG